MTPEDLKALQVHLGLTNEQLAHRLGYTYETISLWRTGKVPISNKAEFELLRLIHPPDCYWCGQAFQPDD